MVYFNLCVLTFVCVCVWTCVLREYVCMSVHVPEEVRGQCRVSSSVTSYLIFETVSDWAWSSLIGHLIWLAVSRDLPVRTTLWIFEHVPLLPSFFTWRYWWSKVCFSHLCSKPSPALTIPVLQTRCCLTMFLTSGGLIGALTLLGVTVHLCLSVSPLFARLFPSSAPTCTVPDLSRHPMSGLDF